MKSELLNTPQSVEETDNNESTGRVEAIEGTPFVLVRTEEGKFIAMGNHRLTEVAGQVDPLVYEAIGDINWNFMLNVIAVAVKGILKQIEEEKGENK